MLVPRRYHLMLAQPLFRGLLCGILATGLVSCGRKTETPPSPPAPSSTATNAPTTASVKPEFQKLTGSWLRPDGGYIVQIKNVDADGKMDTAYLNPNPINVSKAMAIQDGATTKVFIELRDVNYPGCTYSLKYDSQSDQLFGQYYQAAVDQTYDVVFERMK